ncbi:MAG: hypothetical protein Q8S33_30775 [Myxococcales bacterium]|nr:hypothetical protein [Myxococcales bacterium]
MPRLVVALLLSSTVALAGSNSPENALARTKDEVLLKLNLLCGATFTVRYDGDSLRQHNKDIGWDQTGGDLECNEPLRYLWSLCGTETGKAVVRRSEVREVVCKGTPAAVGSLAFKAGVVTVERAYEESTPFKRSRKQFEAAFKTTLTLEEDPYSDDAWRSFRQLPNPVTSTTNYCLVDDVKKEFNWYAADRATENAGAKKVKCFSEGTLVIDVTVKDRKKTGLITQVRDAWRRRYTVKDNQEDGLDEVRDGDVLLSTAMFNAGQRVWEKEFHPNGALKRYWRQYPKPLQVSLDLRDDGKVTSISCAPDAKDDEVLRTWCGFAGEKTIEVYDGTKKLDRTVSYRDGLLTKQVAGDSTYATRSTLSYVEGKPDGEERRTRRDGTLDVTVTWKRGVQHGLEKHYSDDGKKLVEEFDFRDGALLRHTTFFLNGNKKLDDVRDGAKQSVRTEYFDLGAVSRKGNWIPCERRYGRESWCEDGLHTSFFESGTKRAEETFTQGKRVSAKRWYETGVLQANETYEKDRLSANTTYFPDGGVASDDAFEADGSRKLRR